jgi:coenzyme PQQ biosynthesis protein PqqD
MTIDAAFVPKLAKKARLRFDRHSKKTMIIYPERGLELNEAAAAIANKLDGTRTVAMIAAELAQEHQGASAAEVEKDVIAFVVDLQKKGLLERG